MSCRERSNPNGIPNKISALQARVTSRELALEVLACLFFVARATHDMTSFLVVSGFVGLKKQTKRLIISRTYERRPWNDKLCWLFLKILITLCLCELVREVILSE